MKEEIKIIIRDAKESDMRFICATWQRGNFFGNAIYKRIPQGKRFREFTDEVIQFLKEPGIKIKIACDENEPEWAVGFSVIRGDTLHWIHVKEDYRNKGIGKLLLGGLGIVQVHCFATIGQVSHQTKERQWVKKK